MANTSGPSSLPLYVTPEKHGADLVSPVSEKASSNRSQFSGKELPILVRPIEWPSWIKHVVLLQMVAHAGMASWCASAFIPAFGQMSIFFHHPISDMTYLVGSYTLMMGFGVLIWNPLADRIGRRPVLLISMLVTIAATCGAARAPTYGTMIVARIFQGFGICAPCSLGAVYINDMYCAQNRGKALGAWTLGITAGPFIAPFVCGFIANRTKFTWIIWFEALLLSALFLFELLLLPESLVYAPCYRNVFGLKDIIFQLPESLNPTGINGDQSIAAILPANGKNSDFSNSFKMTLIAVGYPAVWLCGLGFAVPYGYIAVGVSSIFPIVYGVRYHFNPSTQGLLYLPMLIGSILAELITGRLGDWAVAQPHKSFVGGWIAKRNMGRSRGVAEASERVPEMRLIVGLFGVLLSIAGLVWFGVGVKMHLHWANLAVATGLAAFGVQMLTSVCFSYVIDCYPESAKEMATVMNLFRVLSSFVVLFYNVRLNASVGYAWSFGIQSFVTSAFGLGGLGLLVLFGGKWRLGSSTF